MKTSFAMMVLACFLMYGRARADVSPLAVDLELVVAVDVSYSMGLDEQRAQRDGYVAALRSSQVIAAIRDGALGRIAVTYIEWGGSVVEVVPWTVIDKPMSAYQFAEQLRRRPIARLPYTSISNALAYARHLIRTNRYEAKRRVIDISGDGPNNFGAPAPVARNAALAEGIVIDGLPVMLQRPAAAPTIADIDVYYEKCVIGGDGAFVMTVTSLDDFAATVRHKLVTEIAGLRVSSPKPRDAAVIPVQYVPSYNCFIGEDMRAQ